MSVRTNWILLQLEMALKKRMKDEKIEKERTKDELLKDAEMLIDKLNADRKRLKEENTELKCLCYDLQRKLRRIELGV